MLYKIKQMTSYGLKNIETEGKKWRHGKERALALQIQKAVSYTHLDVYKRQPFVLTPETIFSF